MPSAKRRQQLHEPYRTVLGHFRHEIGRLLRDRLIAGSHRLSAFRQLFGDERQDYSEALKRHYEAGAPADWQERFVSAYSQLHIHGKTGPRPGRITCTWPTRWKPAQPVA